MVEKTEMKNSKKSKSKLSRQSQNIHPINPEIQYYQEALNIYRRHPCLPALFAVMDKALEVGVRFQEIESVLDLLTGIEIDQFYGAYGSSYFCENDNKLESLSAYRPHSADVLAVSEVLWIFLGRISGDDLWGYQNYLVGISDFCYLKEKEDVGNIDPGNGLTDILNNNTKSALTELAYNHAAALDQKEKIAKLKSEEDLQLGLPMIQWASWVTDLISSRPLFNEGLSDFSDYLSLYYVNREELDLSDFGFASNPKKIDNQNAISVAKIAAFIIFAPLFKKNIYKGGEFKIEPFWSERIEYLSSRDSFDDLDDKSEYLVAISNLLMVCAKLNIESVTNGIVSDDELERDFLSDVYADYLDGACLAPLPGRGFVQMLVAINNFEGDRADDYLLTYVLRVTDYGLRGSPDPDHLDELFTHAFQGMDSELAETLRNRIERSVKRWVVPLQYTKDLRYLYSDFWSDHVIVEKISESLVETDKKKSSGCLFLREELLDTTVPGDYLSEDLHPAIFTRKFSNVVDFMDFDDHEWLKFAQSLYLAGQTRYAATLLALYLTICGIKRIYYPKASNSIDIPATCKLLRQLSAHDSFQMVRQAIADLFEMYENVPAIYRGSLQEFLPASKAALTLLKVKEKQENKFIRYKKSMIEEGYQLDRLSNQSQDFLVRGYTYARSPELTVYQLSLSALQSYLSAIESELRSRSTDVDRALAEELEYFSIDIVQKPREGKSERRGVFKGLAGIIKMLESFSKLSPNAQEKLSGFYRLATHSDINLFLSSMKDFTKIRNPIQHGDLPNLSGDPVAKKLLARIERLLFDDGGIVRVLCETR